MKGETEEKMVVTLQTIYGQNNFPYDLKANAIELVYHEASLLQERTLHLRADMARDIYQLLKNKISTSLSLSNLQINFLPQRPFKFISEAEHAHKPS
ncbi:hypothetical protein T4D_8563 [Trichinella pseudospiralis]|uniref:Uncharacterized protein n=1 Tax=Trichinella pseudospiralis TaxID=6337 RepID=A0A0V1FDC1_TRIPS|nr:hypothetical protein T4D_8563 [Trichinella pseudospiralis]